MFEGVLGDCCGAQERLRWRDVQSYLLGFVRIIYDTVWGAVQKHLGEVHCFSVGNEPL